MNLTELENTKQTAESNIALINQVLDEKAQELKFALDATDADAGDSLEVVRTAIEQAHRDGALVILTAKDNGDAATKWNKSTLIEALTKSDDVAVSDESSEPTKIEVKTA